MWFLETRKSYICFVLSLLGLGALLNSVLTTRQVVVGALLMGIVLAAAVFKFFSSRYFNKLMERPKSRGES